MSIDRPRPCIVTRGWPLPALLLAALVGGCASGGMTLQQELAWESWKACDRFPTVRMDRIEPDGRIHVKYLNLAEYREWAQCVKDVKAQQASRGLAQHPSPVGTAMAPFEAASRAVPVWSVGDQWAYRWEDASGKGTYVWSVDRVERLEGIEYYVIKTGSREIFYRATDLAIHVEKVGGIVDKREVPPLRLFDWPLEVGKTWTQAYAEERPKEPRTRQLDRGWRVESEEIITVPGGTFRALKIVCRNQRTGAPVYEMWFSPELKQWARIVEYVPSGKRERELIAHKVRSKSQGRLLTRVMPEAPPVSGTLKDDAEAVRAYRKAAEAGDGRAMASLGFMYFTGRGGLAKDDAEAVRWYKKGADAGDGFAMALLGAGHWGGLGGLPRNETEAIRWYRKGADAGSGRAMALLGHMYLTGGGGLAKNEAEAARWYKKGADAGDGRAMASLGSLYEYGEGGLASDEVEAVRWYRRGAEAGDGFAMASLGAMYETAKGGLVRDEAQAVRWYRRGVQAGSGRAMAELGRMYFGGQGGLPRDHAEAVRLYREGAELLDAVAMFELGQAYEAGDGVTRDRREAVRWYRQAATFGLSDATDWLRALGEGS